MKMTNLHRVHRFDFIASWSQSPLGATPPLLGAPKSLSQAQALRQERALSSDSDARSRSGPSSTHRPQRILLGVLQRPLTRILLQKHRDRNGSRIVIQFGGVYTTFCQDEGILLQKYRDRNGRCIAIVFKVS